MKAVLIIILIIVQIWSDDNLSIQLNDYNTLFYEQGSQEAIDAVENDLKLRKVQDMWKHIPKRGDKVPDFTLNDMDGKEFNLYAALREGPIILFWYRGGWCPYCNLQLAYYQKYERMIREAGGRLIGVAPEVKEMGDITRNDHDITFTLLSDPGNVVAKRYNIVYTVESTLLKLMDQRFGLDDYYPKNKQELPLTIAYVIDQKGIIHYAYIDDDFRKRAEPEEMLKVLKNIGR